MFQALTVEETLLNAFWHISKCFPQHLPFRLRQDYFLVLVFYKAICDHWQDDADELRRTYPDLGNAQQVQLCTELLRQLRFVIPAEAHLKTLLAQAQTHTIGALLEQAFSRLELANPDKLMGLFRHLPCGSANESALVEQGQLFQAVLAALRQSAFDLKPSRFAYAAMVGRLFSNLLERFTFSAPMDVDNCPTPSAVARLMASLLAPRVGQSIYDPACGVGNLLLACGQWINSKHVSKEFSLFGEDFCTDNLRLARMQMLLLDIQHQLRNTESLNAPAFLSANESLPQFDIAICHPPENIPAWLVQMLANSPFQQFGTSLPEPDKAGFGFVLHMLACLKPESGRMAALLPYAALQRGGSDQAIRQKLLEANLIDAVIALPDWLFPETDRRYAIILLQHGRLNQSVCMLDASHIAQDNLITVERIADFYHIGRDVPGYARMVNVGELIADGGSLDVAGISA